ncbi:hypothetical protein LLG96_02590 [bacterium]|nr:hypothetical protein [bacterium]
MKPSGNFTLRNANRRSDGCVIPPDALAALNADEKTSAQCPIDVTDRQIDALVYELYGLTEEEIAIVEETGR